VSWPTKILPFRKLTRAVVVDEIVVIDDEFPRFHKEQLRGPLLSRPLVVGFSIPPLTTR
jgi:hypothetical protein